MRHIAYPLRVIACTTMVLATTLAGCAQVIDIQDWTASGGAGGQPGSTSAGSGGAQSASAAGSGGGTTGGELCTNGLDDDNDGKVDCADSDCSDHTCTPTVPDGWSGPVAVYLGPSANPPPECGPRWAGQSDWMAGTLMAPPAQCSACECTTPTGGQCTLFGSSGITFFNDLNCMNVDVSKSATMPNTCTVGHSSPGLSVAGYKITAAASPSNSACTPNGGVVATQPASFEQVVRICENTSDPMECESGGVCVPPPPEGFRASLCIYQQASDNSNTTCPTGYNALAVVYSGIADMRSCTPCQCGGPMGQSCTPSARVYATNQCIGSGLPQTLDDCNPFVNPLIGASIAFTLDPGTPMGGQCYPSGAAPIGEAAGTGRAMVCCLP